MTLALALGEGTLRLNDLKGTVAGASVAGRLTVELQQQPVNLNGDLEIGVLDLAAALGTAAGVPATVSNEAPAGPWSAEPFKEGVRGVGGQIAIKAGRVPLLPHLAARDFQGTLYLGESQLALRVADARVADGRLAGELIFLRDGPGVIARTRLKLSDANLAEMFGDEALSGRLALEISAEGTGMSPVALVGALEGGGRITLTNGRVGRLNPAAFESIMRAVDRGLPIDAARVGDRMTSALAGGALGIRRAESGISIEGGQARLLSNPVLATPNVDLAVNAHINLAEGVLDTRLTLSAMPGAPAKTWPEVVVTLKGPLDSPRRTIDVSAFTSWLALRAVEQQSKKLDVLEGGEAASGATADPPGRVAR
jgi:large subunit ribosomal protein L24